MSSRLPPPTVPPSSLALAARLERTSLAHFSAEVTEAAQIASYLRSHSKGQSGDSAGLQFQASPQRGSANGQTPAPTPLQSPVLGVILSLSSALQPQPPLPLCPYRSSARNS